MCFRGDKEHLFVCGLFLVCREDPSNVSLFEMSLALVQTEGPIQLLVVHQWCGGVGRAKGEFCTFILSNSGQGQRTLLACHGLSAKWVKG